MFNDKDNLEYHQGGLAYEDRRVEILNDLKAVVNAKVGALKASKESKLKTRFLSRAYDGYVKMSIKLRDKMWKEKLSPTKQGSALEFNEELDVSHSIELLDLNQFQAFVIDQVYTTAHKVAVAKISRCYLFLRQQRAEYAQF